MNINNLVKMANQIGSFFAAATDRELAIRNIAEHISRTWDPRMRIALLEYADRADGEGLQEDVRKALTLIRAPTTL